MKYIPINFDMELYDEEQEEDIFVSVECFGYIGTTPAMGDDPTDVFDITVVHYSSDGIELEDITHELSKHQQEAVESAAFEELLLQHA